MVDSHPQALWAEQALLPQGWAENLLIQWDDQGIISQIIVNPSQAQLGKAAPNKTQGPLLPGLTNLHSHAFQRGFGGLTEYRQSDQRLDSFWTWRKLMYQFVNQITPETMQAMALWAYVEMLEAGYTSLCEFHYIHHQRGGIAYQDKAIMAKVIMEAAKASGIGLTLLPVLYQSSGFGGKPAEDHQRCFLHSLDDFYSLLTTLQGPCQQQGVRLGLAPHSLRAVSPANLASLLEEAGRLDPTAPIHIHIAEQMGEVEDCLAWSGLRPMEWLLNHVDVNPHWCFIHATHLSEEEAKRGANTGGVAVLCPTTEANLGDGVFPFGAWANRGGVWGIGSDSHITLNGADELKQLEYSQRLSLRQRNIISSPAHPQVAEELWLGAVKGGARGSGRKLGGLAIGEQADFIILDKHALPLAGLTAEAMLASHIFAASRLATIDSVWVKGRPLVKQGRHPLHDQAAAGFIAARKALLA